MARTLKDDKRKMFLAFVNAVSEVQAEAQLDCIKDDLKPQEKQPIGSLNKLNSELL